MQLPLKLKWLGVETGEMCALLAPYQPLIYVSPTPQLEQPPSGLTPIAYRVARVLDLRDARPASPPTADPGAGGQPAPAFEVAALEYTAQELAAVYDFYFEVYLKSMSLGYVRGHTPYTYVEWLRRELLGRRFVAFVRAGLGGRAVAGCLLRRFLVADFDDRDGVPEAGLALGEDNTVSLALYSIHPQYRDLGLDLRMLAHAADWAWREGYSFVVAATEPGFVIESDQEDAAWLSGRATTPVLHRARGSLLYCDLGRCSYLSHDFYYYSCEGPEPYLHYVANVLPGASQAVSFLNSLTGIRKFAHTRHDALRSALARAGVECELIR